MGRHQQYHLIENVAGEKVVLHVRDFHSDRDAIVIRPLLQTGGKTILKNMSKNVFILLNEHTKTHIANHKTRR